MFLPKSVSDVGILDEDGYVDIKKLIRPKTMYIDKNGKYIFPDDISRLIASYNPRYKLKPWVSLLNLRALAENPSEGTLELFTEIIKKIPKDRLRYGGDIYYVDYLALNRNPDIVRYYISNYKVYLPFLRKNTTKVARNYLKSINVEPYDMNLAERSADPEQTEFVLKHLDILNYEGLSRNPNPIAVRYLSIHPQRIYWSSLSENPSAIKLLEKNQDKINWKYLSKNPSAIKLLEKNQDKINWYELSKNPAIFEEETQDVFKVLQNLTQFSFKPKQLKRSK